MPRPDDRAARLSALRFADGRLLLQGWLRALLGPRPDVLPIDDPARAAEIHAEYRASERAAEGQDWALARQAWPLHDIDELVDTLHRLSNNLGTRAVWLVFPGRAPQACSLASSTVLDNPLGFAGLDDHELAILDQGVPAGLSLKRHDANGSEDLEDEWELVVWGEPWLSAATRALRGEG